ncbi:Coenzyme F420 hydrogenase/dehydrogenase, beta subunit C-terminal domain [Aquamicrobium soli]|uniref:Coenzyme F420 hydrogenase/dehydrogenase, beta subunit C-terminal domain n=1 Tax=Aquamicrobium soli TaxID=1811518 RepID=A0ABV7KB44_9HYPH
MAQSSEAHARMSWDRYGHLKPELGLAEAAFGRICPFAPSARNEDQIAESLYAGALNRDSLIGRFQAAYVGHVDEGDFRTSGSSGGMASWMAVELLRRCVVDGIAHVRPADPRKDGRFFRYAISRNEAEIRSGACSRYYPVDLSEVLQTIRHTPGRYAVVGIPCFIKAVNLLIAEDAVIRQRIVCTLGLFCGHMKSARFVDSMAWQAGVNPSAVRAIDYRVKTPGRPASWYRARLELVDGNRREKDWWDLVDGDWGAGFFQNPACNYCDDVVAETADIAFGDAWIEPYSSDARGTNVVVVRKPELDGILREAAISNRIRLAPVDAQFVRQTQAAGLRHRREGLAYRLQWKPPSIPISKRVGKSAAHLGARRKLVYRARYLIARESQLTFALAKNIHLPGLYLWWAKAAVSLYQALAYSRGAAGRLFDMLEKICGRG